MPSKVKDESGSPRSFRLDESTWEAFKQAARDIDDRRAADVLRRFAEQYVEKWRRRRQPSTAGGK